MRVSTASLLLVALASCTDLPPIESRTCGNGVVEPEAGEDCDRFASSPSAECRQPGELLECRYVCGERENGTRPDCPTGMQCALDGLCRWPSGSFDRNAITSPASPHELLTSDFDGDQRADLVVAERDRILVRYFGDRAEPSGELDVPGLNNTGPLPAIADLSEDGLPDLMLPYAAGVVASLGSKNRELLPTAYASIALASNIEDAHFISVDVFPQLPGPEALVLAGLTGVPGGAVVYLAPDYSIEPLTFTLSPKQLADDVKVGNVYEDPVTSPCDDLIWPFKDLPVLFSYPPCKLDPSQGIVLNKGGPAIEIALPDGDTVLGPVSLADLDHDGHLDLAATAQNGGSMFIDVAYGLGDGTFNSQSPVGTTADGKAKRAGDLGTTKPLAIADLDGDGYPDYVASNGVFLWRSTGWKLAADGGSDSWSSAVVADLNGNGIPDVFAAIDGASGAHFLNGAGSGSFSPFVVASNGPLTHLAVGDYDGDLILDVSAAEKAPGTSGDFVSILFGQSAGAPLPARRMGLVGEVLQLTTSRASPPGTPQWATDDITTFGVTPDNLRAFAGFGGRGDRRIRAPYTPIRTDSQPGLGNAGLVVYRVALGQFDEDTHADLMELCSSSSTGTDDLRMWLVPMADEARIRMSAALPGATLPAGADFVHSEIATGDLDGDGIDELVLLAPEPASGAGSRAYVAQSVDTGSGREWVLGSPKPLSWRFEQVENLEVPNGGPGGGRLHAADLDGDGNLDLVALAPEHDAVPGALVVFPGDGSTTLADPIPLPETPDGPPTAFALLQADRGASPELALLAGHRVYLAHRTRGVEYDVAPKPVAELAGATLVVAADFDGDGVQDLALGTPTSVAILRGIPGIQ